MQMHFSEQIATKFNKTSQQSTDVEVAVKIKVARFILIHTQRVVIGIYTLET